MNFQTTTRRLRDLVSEFHSGAILLPQFQRDYVWRPTKIRNLLDSLLKGLGFGFSFAFRALVLLHRESSQFARLKPDWMDTPGPHGRRLTVRGRNKTRTVPLKSFP